MNPNQALRIQQDKLNTARGAVLMAHDTLMADPSPANIDAHATALAAFVQETANMSEVRAAAHVFRQKLGAISQDTRMRINKILMDKPDLDLDRVPLLFLPLSFDWGGSVGEYQVACNKIVTRMQDALDSLN